MKNGNPGGVSGGWGVVVRVGIEPCIRGELGLKELRKILKVSVGL